ncbi:hypothetical protein GCM10022409_11950 [Hymenobacter glaciei]|uniref:Transmembrane protein n=2 Tax=Hymenobacter glaciei TaxID=877209 RepID=A0ABP7TPE8_9BACT
MLLPFVVLCYYSHPGADDFTDAVQRQAFGFWGIQRDLYLNLTGRLFTSVLLMEASPLTSHHLSWYGMAPAGALLLLGASLYWLVSVLVGPAWRWPARLLAAGLLLALWLLQNPSIAESVYWFNGLAVYTVPTAVLVGWLAALVRYWLAAPTARPVWLTLVAALGTCVLWSNEIVALPLMAVIAGLALWQWWRGSPRRTALLALTTWYALALAVSLLAPGNMARADLIAVEVPPLVLLLGPVGASVYMLLNWLSSGVLLATTAIALPVLARLVAAGLPALRLLHTLRPRQLLLALGLLLALLPLAALPSYWATAGLMPPRARASVYLVFLVGWFAAVLVALVVTRRQAWQQQLVARRAWPRLASGLLWGWFLISFFSDHNVRVAHRDLGRESNNVVLAYRDWLSGSAARYNEALQTRYQLLRTASTQSLQVPALPLTGRPPMLLYHDLTTDSTFGLNQDYARYFGLRTAWTGPGGRGRPPRSYQASADD